MGTLTETSTVDCFSNLKWPKLPDNPGQGLLLKLRASREKRIKFSSIQDEAAKNQSRIAGNREAVEAQFQVSSGRKKVGAPAAIASVLNATLEAEKKFADMANQLGSTVAEIDKDIAEFESMITTTTPKPTSTMKTVTTSTTLSTLPVTSTSTVLTTTTTTLPPCGELLI